MSDREIIEVLADWMGFGGDWRTEKLPSANGTLQNVGAFYVHYGIGTGTECRSWNPLTNANDEAVVIDKARENKLRWEWHLPVQRDYANVGYFLVNASKTGDIARAVYEAIKEME